MQPEIPSISESIHRSEKTDGVTFLSRAERIKTLKEGFGFYPQSNEEASRAINLLGRTGSMNPVLSHLNEVYVHQQRNGYDGREAIRSVVGTFVEYAGNAADESRNMEGFLERYKELQPNAQMKFKRLFPESEWLYDGTLRATFTGMARYIETKEFAESEEGSGLGKRELIDYTAGSDRIQRITDVLGPLRAADLQRVAVAAQQNQEQRFTFWADQLEDAKTHLFVRDVASTALAALVSARR